MGITHEERVCRIVSADPSLKVFIVRGEDTRIILEAVEGRTLHTEDFMPRMCRRMTWTVGPRHPSATWKKVLEVVRHETTVWVDVRFTPTPYGIAIAALGREGGVAHRTLREAGNNSLELSRLTREAVEEVWYG